jgi:hypothetical protein
MRRMTVAQDSSIPSTDRVGFLVGTLRRPVCDDMGQKREYRQVSEVVDFYAFHHIVRFPTGGQYSRNCVGLVQNVPDRSLGHKFGNTNQKCSFVSLPVLDNRYSRVKRERIIIWHSPHRELSGDGREFVCFSL